VQTKAARIFEPERGYKLSTMAVRWTWVAIRRASELEGFSGREKPNIASARKRQRLHFSQMRHADSEDDCSFDPVAPPTDNEHEGRELADWIWSQLGVLPPRDARIVRARVEGRTLREVAEDEGISGRVRQIEESSLAKLRIGPLRMLVGA